MCAIPPGILPATGSVSVPSLCLLLLLTQPSVPWLRLDMATLHKRGQLCSPLGDAPTSSNSECRKETGPPSEASQASRTPCYSGTSPWMEWDGGFGAHPPPPPPLCHSGPPPSGRTELVLSPPCARPADRGPCPMPHPPPPPILMVSVTFPVVK
ncbi:hypothetical protein P7K49_027533 [Saguinus oedipus]|uniref:Uncharacterized protein n=1 Tax=Saguinus oedipus TaxID=9490 RepID=A0ABQ9UAK0_SAGOE|nr:hypothetical protein P7K49_027533 [Saguinus oedipus]